MIRELKDIHHAVAAVRIIVLHWVCLNMIRFAQLCIDAGGNHFHHLLWWYILSAFGFYINFCIYAMLHTQATFPWPTLYIWHHIKFLCTHSVIFCVWYSPKHTVLWSATLQVKHTKMVSTLHFCSEQTLRFWYPLLSSCAPRISKLRFLLVVICQCIPPCYICSHSWTQKPDRLWCHTYLVYWAYILWNWASHSMQSWPHLLFLSLLGLIHPWYNDI
jgi:hypothetical protein